MKLHVHKYAAELLGTFLLTLAVSVSLVIPVGLPTPLVAGFTLMILVYALGAISGAHFNPAVTVGMLTVGKISPKEGFGYILVQCVGGLLAVPFTGLLAPALPDLVAVEGLSVALAEFVGAFVLVMAIAAVVYGRTPREASGLAIGGALAVGAMIATAGSAAALNPAIALGLGLINVSYLVAPLLGGIAAALLYRWVLGEK